MSRADELFIENCKDILAHGVWDTDLEVRPRWQKRFLANLGFVDGAAVTVISERPTAISWG